MTVKFCIFNTVLFFSLGPSFQEKVEDEAERYIINTIPIVGPSTRHQLLQRLGRPPLLQPQISASRFFCNQTRAHSPRREAIGSHRENLRVQAYRYSENLFHVYSDSNLEMIHSNGDIFENCVPQHLLPF